MLELLDLRDRRERLEPRRLEIDPHVSETVRGIVRRVRDEGDDALLDLALRFDGADLRERGLVVPAAELAAAVDAIPAELRRALDALIDRVADLHRRQLPPAWHDERSGVRFGELVRPIRAAGCYVPGGRAVYPSSVVMTVTPALVAGVEEIVVCTPPRADGSVHPAVLYAAARAGATRVVRVGGAQAIAALAYGTSAVPAVDKVVGPGNAYVTEAKRQLNGVIGIDGLAGPTELVLVAGPDADPRWVALDLVAQAEHDPDAVATLVATDATLLDRVEDALVTEVAAAGRRDVVERALDGGARGAGLGLGPGGRGRQRPRARAPPAGDHVGGSDPGRDPQRRRDLRRLVHAGAVRRLRRRVQPRAPHGRDGPVRERPPGGRLREGDVGRRDGRRRGGDARPRGLDDRPERGAAGTRPGGRGPGRGSQERAVIPALPRPGLREVEPYEAPQLAARARLNTNECPYPLPDAFRDELAAAVRELVLNRYPDREAETLRSRLADLHGHALEGTWAANGSNEILVQLLQAYGGPGRRVVVFEPTYALHARLAWVANSDVVRIPIEPPWTISARDVAEAFAHDPAVVFVCSPNNPTGNAQPLDAVELAANGSALVVVDEAYVEFGGTSAAQLVPRYRNLAVVRTFSKAFALAGARIGYCLTSAEVVQDLRRVRLPYHLGAMTQTAGLVALDHRDEALAILDAIRAERDRILLTLPALGVETFPSDANFVLFRPPAPAGDVWRGLLERGVLVRDFSGLVPGCLRVTAGTPSEVDLFLSALEEVLA